jgi:hypothetical protein
MTLFGVFGEYPEGTIHASKPNGLRNNRLDLDAEAFHRFGRSTGNLRSPPTTASSFCNGSSPLLNNVYSEPHPQLPSHTQQEDSQTASRLPMLPYNDSKIFGINTDLERRALCINMNGVLVGDNIHNDALHQLSGLLCIGHTQIIVPATPEDVVAPPPVRYSQPCRRCLRSWYVQRKSANPSAQDAFLPFVSPTTSLP